MVSRTQQLYDEHSNGSSFHEGNHYVDGCPTCDDPIEKYWDNFRWNLDVATSRGWNRTAHFNALLAEDVDAISLTHPTNWLNEGEVENGYRHH